MYKAGLGHDKMILCLANICKNCHARSVLFDFFVIKCSYERKFKVLHTARKVSKYGVFSGPYFPVFGLNTEIYSVNLHIQSKYGKIRTTFHAVTKLEKFLA